MITLVEHNKNFDYKIYRSDVIVNQRHRMIQQLVAGHKILLDSYNQISKDSTWLYKTYNVFSLVGPDKNFHDLYRDLVEIVKLNTDDKHIWFQSWLNFHKHDQVLKWHNHSWFMHGYISIDPKMTKTVFDNYEVLNEPGNIYIGPGNRRHRVEVLEQYSGYRITLGFDVNNKAFGPSDMLSMIPVV